MKLLLNDKETAIEKCDNDLYTLVGTTKSGVNDFRKKFEETEKRIKSKTGTPDEARREYFNEIENSTIKCLPEFQDRYIAMKKILEWSEGVKKTLPVTTASTYIVVKGDCLWRISILKYNSPYYWPVIWEANKNGVVNKDEHEDVSSQTVLNPNLIYPGQELRIPAKSDTEKLMKESLKSLRNRRKSL
jgi:nucleoid-associated protein YgaU